MGRCAARPAVRGGAPSLSSVAELVARRRLRHDGRVATAVLGRADAHVQPALGLVVTADACCLSNSFCSVLLCPVHGLDPIPQRVVPSGGAAREAAAGTLGSISGFPLSCSQSTDLADVLGFNFTNVLAPAEQTKKISLSQLKACTAQIAQFVHGIRILLFARVGVYRRFVNGTASATRAPCEQSP